MRTRHPLGSIRRALALALIAGVAAPASPALAATRNCGAKVYAPKDRGSGLIIGQLRATRVGCSTALRVAGRDASGERNPGWTCRTSKAMRTRCTRGRRVVSYMPGGSAH